MSIKAVEVDPWQLEDIPDRYKTEEACEKTVEKDPWLLKDVPDHLKTRKMCEDALTYYPFSLEYVPDWFVTQGQLKLWHDNNYAYNDEGLSKWYEGYQKRKAQKASIEDKLMPTALDPSRYWDCCMSEEEKKRVEALWA